MLKKKGKKKKKIHADKRKNEIKWGKERKKIIKKCENKRLCSRRLKKSRSR